MSKHVIIVGAGPGGLATSMLLAAKGLQVTVLERLPTIGGRTSSIEAEGFTFDLGPTFFLYPRVLEEIFSAAGRRLQDEIELIRLDPQYRIIFGGGGRIDATPNVENMERQIAGISPEDAPGFRRFMAENRTKFDRFTPCIQTPFERLSDVLSPWMLKLLPLLNPHQSVDTYLKKFFNDPRVRVAFAFQAKYLGMSPFRCPSLFSILSFLEYEFGVFHPVGGCSAITKAMARVAGEMGVTIRLAEPVEEILFAGRRAVGVRTASGNHRADAVVVNADFARAMQTLVPDKLRSRWKDRRIGSRKFSCSTFMMYLGIDGREDDIAHHSIHIASDYEQNLEDIENRHVLSEDPSFYVQNASVTDPTLAPPGKSALYLLAPVTHQHPNVDWDREKERFRGVMLRQAARIGFRDLEKRIRYERVITPQDWDRSYNIHLGATFNLSHNLGQMLHLRPQNRFDDLDGVYLVGGGTHPGSGLPVIFESSRITSRLLLQDLGLRPDWSGAPADAHQAAEHLSHRPIAR